MLHPDKCAENSLNSTYGEFQNNTPENTNYTGTLNEADSILGLFRRVGRKISTISQLTQLVDQITQMTQSALNAKASSLLLLDDKKDELVFKTAKGQAGETLKRIKLDTGSGIAGWVVRHGKAVLSNNVAGDKRFNGSIDDLTGFTTKSIICAPLTVQKKIIGVVEVLNKLDGNNFSWQDLVVLQSVASVAAISIENFRLQNTILESYKNTIMALVAAIEAKDPYTCGHSQRVMEYALLGGGSLSSSAEELEVLQYAGILHDIGKIGIADRILTKPGSLTVEEWNVMRGHSAIGADIVSRIPFLEEPKELILHHHERYDGRGYPDGLAGEDIPMGARLLAVADAFDTMTTDRSYRSAQDTEYAFRELRDCSGTQFCPVAVDAFISGYNNSTKSRRSKPVFRLTTS